MTLYLITQIPKVFEPIYEDSKFSFISIEANFASIKSTYGYIISSQDFQKSLSRRRMKLIELIPNLLGFIWFLLLYLFYFLSRIYFSLPPLKPPYSLLISPYIALHSIPFHISTPSGLNSLHLYYSLSPTPNIYLYLSLYIFLSPSLQITTSSPLRLPRLKQSLA